MSQVKLPKIQVSLERLKDAASPSTGEHTQINPSCILSYMGLKGYANPTSNSPTIVKKNITSTLAYWDIFKNYHANKQEQIAYYIGKSVTISQYKNKEVTINTPQRMFTPIKNTDTVILTYIDSEDVGIIEESITIKYKTGETVITTNIENIGEVSKDTTNKQNNIS